MWTALQTGEITTYKGRIRIAEQKERPTLDLIDVVESLMSTFVWFTTLEERTWVIQSLKRNKRTKRC